jgi:hypothetical protein
LFLYFIFFLPLMDDTVNGAYSYRFHSNECVYSTQNNNAERLF